MTSPSSPSEKLPAPVVWKQGMTDLAYDQPYVFPPGVSRPRILPETSRSRPPASPAAWRLYRTRRGSLTSGGRTASIAVRESNLQDWRGRLWDEFVGEGYDEEEEPELTARHVEEGMPPAFDEPAVAVAIKNSDRGAPVAGDERLVIVAVRPHSPSARDEDEWRRSLKSACEKRRREPQPRFPQEPTGGPVVRPWWEEWGKNTWVLRQQEILE